MSARNSPRSEENKRPRVLVLDEEVCWPRDSGKRIRTFNLLSELSAEFEIELLVHANRADQAAIQTLEARGIAVHVAPSRIPPKRGLSFAWNLARNLASKWPYSVQSHHQPGFERELRRLSDERAYDLIHCEWSPYASYLLGESGRPWVVAAHNVESMIWRRMAERSSGLKKRFLRLQAQRMLDFERDAFRRCTLATAVSREDQAQIAELGCSRTEVVPNGVDLDYFRATAEVEPEPRSVVFTGSMDWRPNQDAARWFIEEIHPLLLGRGPYRAKFVGRNPPAWLVRHTESVAEIEVTGSVDDVRPYLAEAQIAVVPLRIGGGSRLKILEALAMSRPVVSTRIGAEGLDLEPGRHLLVADQAESFADAIRRLFDDPPMRARLGAAGRERVKQRYDWRSIARIQARLWREAIAS